MTPLHLHTRYEERIWVASGSLTVWSGPDMVVLRSGGYHLIPTDVPPPSGRGPRTPTPSTSAPRPGSPSWSPGRAPLPTSSPPTPSPTWSCSWPGPPSSATSSSAPRGPCGRPRQGPGSLTAGGHGRLPGDRAPGAAPVHRRRPGAPGRVGGRSRGDAVHPRRKAALAGGAPRQGPAGVPALLPAVPRRRLLGGGGEGRRPVPRVVPPAAARGRRPGRARARLPAAPVGLGQGLRHRGIAGPDPRRLHRAGRAAGVRRDDGGQPRLPAGDGEGRPAPGPDVPPAMAGPDRGRRARRGRVRPDQSGVGGGGGREEVGVPEGADPGRPGTARPGRHLPHLREPVTSPLLRLPAGRPWPAVNLLRLPRP